MGDSLRQWDCSLVDIAVEHLGIFNDHRRSRGQLSGRHNSRLHHSVQHGLLGCCSDSSGVSPNFCRCGMQQWLDFCTDQRAGHDQSYTASGLLWRAGSRGPEAADSRREEAICERCPLTSSRVLIQRSLVQDAMAPSTMAAIPVNGSVTNMTVVYVAGADHGDMTDRPWDEDVVTNGHSGALSWLITHQRGRAPKAALSTRADACSRQRDQYHGCRKRYVCKQCASVGGCLDLGMLSGCMLTECRIQ